ncbi:hypothetical protein R1flu_028132 [Riccia fluitans]|uniref:Uncharacterized protein n=1 Tax=Riccia fluitans TaxID=41844 RepID=A0ABD1XKU0_9MARC
MCNRKDSSRGISAGLHPQLVQQLRLLKRAQQRTRLNKNQRRLKDIASPVLLSQTTKCQIGMRKRQTRKWEVRKAGG